MGKVAGGVLLWLALVGGIAAHTGVLLVDVDTADGPDIVVPVPLALARAGLVFAPDDVQRLRVPGIADLLPDVRRVGDVLREAGDATLLTVRGGDEDVMVTAEGNTLRVRVREGGSVRADVAIPLASLESALGAYDPGTRSFETSGLVAALADAPRRELVDVADGGDRVRVRRIF